MFKKNKGITLIALIISIVIMSIIAVVAINALGDKDGGLIGKANSVVQKHNEGQDSELAMLEQYGNIIKQYQNSRIDWDDILNKANENPESYKHKSQDPNNENIGIGTDGQPVNMDLWDVSFNNEAASLSSENETSKYKGEINNGQIIGCVPEQVYKSESDKFVPVTEMNSTFKDQTGLIVAPELPSTVQSISAIFENCTNLKTAPKEIPNSVKEMSSAFSGCSALEGTIDINSDFSDQSGNAGSFGEAFLNAGTEGKGLTLSGNSFELEEIARTQNPNGDITIKANITLDWGKILEDANKNPLKYKHADQTSEHIGIGTDGKPVNMDYWQFQWFTWSEEICLRSSLGTGNAAYRGEIRNGKIIGKVPQYIKPIDSSTFLPVTEMWETFIGNTELVEAPKLPTTTKSIKDVFKNCTNLTIAPTLHEGLEYLNGTFEGCISLVKFTQTLPSTVNDISATFYGCTNLKNGLKVIPNTIGHSENTFYGCTALEGEMEINTEFNGYDGSGTPYEYCFTGAATSGAGLRITGSSSLIDAIIATKSPNSNITRK